MCRNVTRVCYVIATFQCLWMTNTRTRVIGQLMKDLLVFLKELWV